MSAAASATPRAILDTSVVIAADVPPILGELAISAVTLAELHVGVLVATTAPVRAERLRRLTVLQRHFDALPVDATVAPTANSPARSSTPADNPADGSWTY